MALRGQKIGPRVWTARDEGDIRRCYAAADGDREEFDRRVDAVLGLKRKRGRVPTPSSWLIPFSEPVRMTNSAGKAKTPFRFVQQRLRKKRRKARKKI